MANVANPRFAIGMNDVVETDRSIGAEILAMRDVMGKPIAIVTSDPKDIKRSRRLRPNNELDETWGLEDGDE